MACVKYILLDTNCFINAMHKRQVGFDFEKIKQYAKEENAYITISAFSLYELIQNLTTLEQVKLFRNQLIHFGDFWVLGNNIFEHKGIEYGLDFLFLLNLHNDEMLRAFANKRDKIRADMYQILFQKMFYYASLVATCAIYLKECDDRGGITLDTHYKLKYVCNHFFEEHRDRYTALFSDAYKHDGLPAYNIITQEFYTDSNAKDELEIYMLNLIIEMLARADVVLTLAKKEWEYDPNEYNRRLAERYMKFKSTIKTDSFRKLSINAKKRSQHKVTIEKTLDELMYIYPEGLHKESYQYMVEKLYNDGSFGSKFNNDFIDLSNLTLLETFEPGSAVYLTTEKSWLRLILKNKDNMYVKETLQFIRYFGISSEMI